MDNEYKDYKLEGLKNVRDYLANKNTVVAYSDSCSPDPHGFNRNCDWSYYTLNMDMKNYPCPWDTSLLYKKNNKGKKYDRGGCFYRCLLNSNKCKKDEILKKKEAYIQVMDKLIYIMENDRNWRTTLSESSLLSKESRKNIHKKKSDKQVKNTQKKTVLKKSYDTKDLGAMAKHIIEYVKKHDISVIKYSSKGSNSIYLKFDYGLAGSLRISDTESSNDLHYTFNVLTCIDKPYKTTGKSSNGYDYEQFFYSPELVDNVAKDIVRFSEYRKSKYGDKQYETMINEYKQNGHGRKGFWQRAELV